MSLFSSILRLGSANIALLAAQALTIIALGIFVPEQQFAIFLLGLTIAQTVSAFAGARFDSAIPSATSAREISALMIMAMVTISVAAGILLILLFLMRGFDLFELGSFPYYSLFIITGIAIMLSLIQLGRYRAIRLQRLKLIERATYARASGIFIARVGIIAWLAMNSDVADVHGLGGLLLVSELIVSSLTSWMLLKAHDLQRSRGRVTPAIVRATLRRNWKFPTLETPSAIINSVALNAPIFLITQFFGLTATAAFGLAFRAIAVPIGQLALAITEVMQSQYSLFLRQGDAASFKGLFYRSSALLLIGSLIVCPVIFLLAEPVTIFLFGEKLRLFAQIAAIIAPWIAMNVLVNVNSRIITLVKRQELKLVYDAIGITIVAGLALVQLFLPLPLLSFVLLMTVAYMIAYAIYWLLIRQALLSATARF